MLARDCIFASFSNYFNILILAGSSLFLDKWIVSIINHIYEKFLRFDFSLSFSFISHTRDSHFDLDANTCFVPCFFSSLKYNIPQRVHLERVRATVPQNNSRMRGLHKGSCLPANIGRNIYIRTRTHLISLRPLNKPSLLILISDFPVDGRESNVCGTTNEEKRPDRYSIKREICPVISRANDFVPRPFDSFESEDIYPGSGIIPFF